MRRLGWMGAAALGLLGLVTTSCERSRDTPESSQASVEEQAALEQQSLERDALLNQTTARLERIDRQIAALEVEYAKERVTTVKQLAALERLHDARAEATQAIDAVRVATTDVWAKISTGLEGTVAGVEKAYEAALNELHVDIDKATTVGVEHPEP